jgi:hypothetical protein
MVSIGNIKNRGIKSLREIISSDKYTPEQKAKARKELRSRSK